MATFDGTLLAGPVAYGLVFVLGALFGSFANVCIVRLPPTEEHPRGRSVVSPGSHCGACQAPVAWYDNLPILSYLILRGRCRGCGAEFSPRYLLVEAATGMIFVAVYHLTVVLAVADAELGDRLLRFAIYAAFSVVMVVIAFIDLDHKLILNKITYPAIPIFYGLAQLLPGSSWREGLIGAAVGYGVIRAIADGYWLAFRREGMGYGDGKLLAIVGALLGWKAVVATLFLGSLYGAVVNLPLLLVARWRDRGARAGEVDGESEGDGEESEPTKLRHVEVPFGPALAAAAISFLFLEPWLELHFFEPLSILF
jgi:leader peptidase (prepilin peptidase) / N-methyltransferase